MEQAQGYIKALGIAVLCFALLLWSAMPAFTHAPTIFETIDDHLEMVEDHGHSHGFEEDLYWAMHGHSHDVIDHDHNHVSLPADHHAEPEDAYSTPWMIWGTRDGPSRNFRIDRPPRV